jgi:Xaa-Pro aminopeptidase
MGAVEETVSLTRETLERVQKELRDSALPGWLLWNFKGANAIASGLLGLPAMSRRYFVFLPAEGAPVALTHRIEQQPWTGWIGEKRVYLSWEELQEELQGMLDGLERVAMEYSASDAVPYVDRVPGGVLELVRSCGVEVVPSADLVTAFYARWTERGLQSHRRAAAALRETALGAFDRIGERLRSGSEPTEWEIKQWVREALERHGLRVEADAIVGVNGNAANPHYAPTAEHSTPIRRGDVVLIDLWGKEDEDAVFADQTWMAFVGREVPRRVNDLWEAARDAREAAVARVRAAWEAGEPVEGWQLDDAARDVIRERGWAEHFIHRTGHSIDRELHGSGPNLDNLETRDTRRLVPGVGFSVEPGIYLPGDLGFRTEIDVYLGPDGPEVTPSEPQREIYRIDA